MKDVNLIRHVKNKSVRQCAILPYLKDIALDTFESRKAELKDDGKTGN